MGLNRVIFSRCIILRALCVSAVSFFKPTALFTLVALLVAGTVSAQNGRFFFAEEPVSPRTVAMGSAGAALAGGGFGCYNPASVALASRPFTSVEYGQQAGGLDKSLIETAWMFRSWFAGASLVFHTTDFQESNEQGLGNMSSGQAYGATFCGGFIYNRFATGHAVMVLNERIGDYSMRAVTYSTGATYQIVPGNLTAGASMYHYLRFDTLPHRKATLPRAWYSSALGLPRMVRAGCAWRDTLPGLISYTVACDLAYRDIDERLMVPIGVEAWVLPNLALRLGKRFRHPGEIADFGIGLRWSSLAFDFDYSPTRPPAEGASAETKWLFGLTYSLGTKKQEPSPVPQPPVKKGSGQQEIIPVPVPANETEPAAADTSGVLPPLDEPSPRNSSGPTDVVPSSVPAYPLEQ